MRQNTLQREADDLLSRFVLNDLKSRALDRWLPPGERTPIPRCTKWYGTGGAMPVRSPTLAHSALAHAQFRDQYERRYFEGIDDDVRRSAAARVCRPCATVRRDV